MNFHFGGYSPSASGVQSEAPVGGLRNEVSQKLKQFADIVYGF